MHRSLTLHCFEQVVRPLRAGVAVLSLSARSETVGNIDYFVQQSLSQNAQESSIDPPNEETQYLELALLLQFLTRGTIVASSLEFSLLFQSISANDVVADGLNTLLEMHCFLSSFYQMAVEIARSFCLV